MDERWLEALVRIVAAEPASRRTLARTLAAGVIGGVLARLGFGEAAARCVRLGRRCRRRDKCCGGGTCLERTCACADGIDCGNRCFRILQCGPGHPVCPDGSFCCSEFPGPGPDIGTCRTPLDQPCRCTEECCLRSFDSVECREGRCCRLGGAGCTSDNAHLCCSRVCDAGHCT